ncbi:MAG: hypothetical protein U0K91_11210, partial [Acutalibacteraceae bacterium]|nr:hypothetical protein [Acutalibacteraceae bacterium]
TPCKFLKEGTKKEPSTRGTDILADVSMFVNSFCAFFHTKLLISKALRFFPSDSGQAITITLNVRIDFSCRFC